MFTLSEARHMNSHFSPVIRRLGRDLLTLLLTLMPLAVSAQEAAGDSTITSMTLIGYLSYDEALKSMPEYVILEKKMADLQQAYEAELKRVEDDFNEKYEAFLEGRKDYPRTILLKRQTELQQLLQRNVEFKEQSQEELAKTRLGELTPLQTRLAEVIADIAHKKQLILVVNTDANACPFIDPNVSVNLNEEVRRQLNK